MRRFLSAFLALCALCSAALAEPFSINFEGGAVAVAGDGAVAIPAGRYESLLTLRGGDGAVSGYAAGIEAGGVLKYAVLSPLGVRITPFRYTSVAYAGGDYICGVGNKYRIVQALGTEGAAEYSALAYAGDGAFLALTGNINDEIADPLSVVTARGDARATGIGVVYGLGEFSEGLMPLCEGGKMRYGYVDAAGSWAIAPAYEYAGDFADGYAQVSTLLGHGMIDAQGSVAVELAYDFLERGDGALIARAGGTLSAFEIGADGIRKAFEAVLDGASPYISGKSVVLAGEDAVRVLGLDGVELFSLPPDASVREAGGLYVIRDGDWADRSAYLADADGRAVSERYNTIRLLDGAGEDAMFAYGVMAETAEPHDMAFGLMRADGQSATEAAYDALVCVRPGLYFVQTGERTGLIDGQGATIADSL